MSLYKRLNDGADEAATGGAMSALANRDPALAEIRHRVHSALIDELGPVLYDKRMTEEDLRARVHAALQNALAQERAPLSAADRGPAHPGRVRRHPGLRPDRSPAP